MGSVAASEIVSIAKSYIGKVTYVPGAEHGETVELPMTEADCSGFDRVVAYLAAIACGVPADQADILGSSTSESQYAAMPGGQVPADGALEPGDIVYRVGDGTYPPPGHVAFCTAYDAGTQAITCVSALGTGLGVMTDVIYRDGNQYMGASRVANLIADPTPSPPAPKLLEIIMFLDTDPNNGAKILVTPAGWYGLNGPSFAYFSENGVPTASKQITKAQLAAFPKLGTV